ncbi:MAG: NfeD family protein [Dysgonomonas sp.]|jgi:membrane protein implicated in regulation of membrane protease activity|uniref:NfeD family protein n=1 Tax=unclassified Dysgonomonas TaxID=2630389 RepID=UPI0025C578C8|nr:MULTISPECIES: NfeD family protein [unclassified Dysgonomonas]MDR1714354.1 NfeD family protein [Prevotella sp.]MDR2002820.1 NfeD family protein [Prevotella sp.]HMM03437.1 NfeD family protein [Dysgonomonas sp.]
MKEFFSSMDATQQFYWYVAIGASVIFIIQTIMTFIGADTDTGIDADFDGNLDGADSPFQLFSLRNLVNFLLGFGWTGAVLYGSFESKIIVGIIAFLVGSLFIILFFLVMKGLMKLSEDNTFKIEDTIGKTADVYMNIPAAKGGKGKIFISIKGSTHELPAITSSDMDIKSGSLVKVEAIEGGILLVSPMAN